MTFTDSFFVIQNFFRKYHVFIFIRFIAFCLKDYAKSEK